MPPINHESPERTQEAMSLAFHDTLIENAGLRVQVKAKNILINEQRGEIARLTRKLEEAGIPVEDAPTDPEKPPEAAPPKPETPAEATPPKPNRRARRAAGKRSPKAKTGQAAAA